MKDTAAGGIRATQGTFSSIIMLCKFNVQIKVQKYLRIVSKACAQLPDLTKTPFKFHKDWKKL